MELDPHFALDEDHGLMIWRPLGVIDQSAVDRIVKLIDRLETTSDTPFNRFTDTLAADMVDLNFQYIFRVSLYRRLAYTGPPVKSAVLVNSLEIAQYWKAHAMLTAGSLIKVQIFRERGEAAKWLDVPIERISQSTGEIKGDRSVGPAR
jgi:hypothetical protein